MKKEGDVTVALDVMGGDFAPAELVKGAVSAIDDDSGISIILVGKADLIEAELAKYPSKESILIEPANEVIKTGEYSALRLRSQGDTSIGVGLRLIKEEQAAGFISAGDTAAVMSMALFTLGRIKGILRPAIAIVIPTPRRPVVLLDAGANADCKPENMVQFAEMGAVYAHTALKVDNPSVGLLNIGEEQGKGSTLVQKAHKLLEDTSLNFVGSVEGKDIPLGKVDVVVCDGFTGNVILKLLEGAAQMFFLELKGVIERSSKGKLAGTILSSNLSTLKERFDYEEYGGAHLLGVKGICVISHGKSKTRAIRNAIGVAAVAARGRITEEIRAHLEK